jgi:hypothetical protein
LAKVKDIYYPADRIEGDEVDMKIEGDDVYLNLKTYSARQAMRAWAMSIVAEDAGAVALARAVLARVGREG